MTAKARYIDTYGAEKYEQHKVRMRELSAAHQQESLKHASNHGGLYTDFDLEVVMCNDFTLYEIAELLGRTYAAVKAKRRELQLAQRQQRALPHTLVD